MIHLLLNQVTKHPTCPKSIDNAFVVVMITILHTMIKGDNTNVIAFWSQLMTNDNGIVFGLTRSGLEPTIYHTRDEHTNHYATDAADC
jgi:hypothetical protein